MGKTPADGSRGQTADAVAAGVPVAELLSASQPVSLRAGGFILFANAHWLRFLLA